MLDSAPKVNKNLWRSISTEKAKRSEVAEQNLSSPAHSYEKETSLYMEPFSLSAREEN